MYDAFDLIRLVEKLPLKICALATWGDSFILSTISSKNEAHLLVYNIKESTGCPPPRRVSCEGEGILREGGAKVWERDYLLMRNYDKIYEAKLTKTLKKFTSKPITQLAVIPEHSIFLGLSDGEVFYADLDSFSIINRLTRSKGASYFAVDWQKLRAHGGFRRELRIAVATKKKLQLYEYKRSTFVLTKSDLNFPDTPRACAWVGDSLIVCIKKELYHVTVDGDNKELFSIGANRSEPCLLPLMNGDILVLRDEQQISLDSNAKPTQPSALVWSELPSQIEHVHPYIVGLLGKGIEVRALEQKIQVQSLKPTDTIKFIASCSKNTLIASQTQVYKLEPKEYDQQVSQFVHGKQFELALQIAELIQEPEEEKRFRKDGILRRFAFYQFTQHKFEESLKNYLQIKEDPVHVIGLYPHLLPSDLRQTLSQSHPTKPPTLSGVELEEGTKHLITYLTQMRYQEQQILQPYQKGEIQLPEDEVKKLEERLQLIDTTLLKCYVKTNNSTLIGSLVRLRDNHLHVAESERILRNEDKFQELVDLYSSKRLHKKALQLLSQFSRGPSGPLSGVWPTIGYLQNLGPESIDLILEYSKWVIKESPDDALRIFTEDITEVQSLPREQVLEHLQSCAPDLTIPYLEHLIRQWSDTTPKFHNRLVQVYQKRVETLLAAYKSINQDRPRERAGEELGELGGLRSKLLQFLSTSKHYVAAEHISSLPQDDMFEERALLLSRLGRHEVALTIYAHVLKEPEMAEEYCRKNYDPDREESREVYLSLIKMYLCPPNLSEYGIRLPEGSQPEANVEDALRVLTAHHSLIDTAKVMDLLPSHTPLRNIQGFLTTVIQERTLHRRRTQLLRSLLLAEHLQVQQQRIKNQAPHFTIHEETFCPACKKRLGTSAFARHPDGTIEHYFCAKEKLSPEQDTQKHVSDTNPF